MRLGDNTMSYEELDERSGRFGLRTDRQRRGKATRVATPATLSTRTGSPLNCGSGLSAYKVPRRMAAIDLAEVPVTHSQKDDERRLAVLLAQSTASFEQRPGC